MAKRERKRRASKNIDDNVREDLKEDYSDIDEFLIDLEETEYETDPIISSDLMINPLELPEEWIKQPTLYDRACKYAEDMQRSRDVAKIDLESIIAETKQRLRYKHRNEKLTEGNLNEKTDTNKDVIRARKLFDTLNQLHAKALNRVRSVDMKRKSLENLVTLIIGQLFSVPNEGRVIKGNHEFEDNIRKKVNAEHRQNLAIAKLRRLQKNSPVRHKRNDEDLTEEEIMDAKDRISTREVADEMEKRIRDRKRKSREESANKPNRRNRKSRNRD